MKVISTLLSLSIWLFCAVGYCMNIYKLASGIDVITTAEAIVRAIGVVAAPLGAIVGYF